MNIKGLLLGFVRGFAVAFIVSVIVGGVWNVIVHGRSYVDWETAFRFAILFGILLPWLETRRR